MAELPRGSVSRPPASAADHLRGWQFAGRSHDVGAVDHGHLRAATSCYLRTGLARSGISPRAAAHFDVKVPGARPGPVRRTRWGRQVRVRPLCLGRVCQLGHAALIDDEPDVRDEPGEPLIVRPPVAPHERADPRDSSNSTEYPGPADQHAADGSRKRRCHDQRRQRARRDAQGLSGERTDQPSSVTAHRRSSSWRRAQHDSPSSQLARYKCGSS